MKAATGILALWSSRIVRMRDAARLHVLRRRYPKWAKPFLMTYATQSLPERVGYPFATASPIPEFQAWTLSWLIKSEQMSVLTELLSQLGYATDSVIPEQTAQRQRIQPLQTSLQKSCFVNTGFMDGRESSASHQTPSIYVCQHSAFAGIIVTVVTNDAQCVEHIQSESRWLAPMPLEAFPQLNPDEFGSLQGELAYWWEYFWQPFWNSRTEEQQRLLSEKLPTPWSDFIADRTV
ncbi:hypothetical protein P0C22_07380 [Plesiomonas shigelloides]|uniref:hypothetical protein n=1 Tax=Plesiomonas shigelloides TaxID=703 RepID=UPI0030BF0197